MTMTEPVETCKVEDLTIRIFTDDDADEPNQWGSDTDAAVLLVTTANPHFAVHPETRYGKLTAEDLQDPELYAEVSKTYRMFPLYAYIHSGVALSMGDFSCPWDSGRIGFVLVDSSMIGEYGPEETARLFVEAWNRCLSGEVYGYVISRDGEADGEEIESCWGFYGDISVCMEEAKSAARCCVDEERYQQEQAARICAL